MPQAVILEHTLTSQPFDLRKDRQYAACRICGAIFQSYLAIGTDDEHYSPEIEARVSYETVLWQQRHSSSHPASEHKLFRQSGRTFSPEAAHRLASYGIVPIGDTEDDEIAQALLESPRIPTDNPEGSY